MCEMSYELQQAKEGISEFLSYMGFENVDVTDEGEVLPTEEEVITASGFEFDRFQREQRKAGIPKRYRFARLSMCAPVIREYAFECRANIKSGVGCRWIMLNGKPGTGKSYSSAAIASDLMDLGATYTNFSTMLTQIRDSYNNREGACSENTIIERYCKVPLLVINDFGKDSIGSQWALGIVFQVLNRRYEEMMATVISTQLSAEDLFNYLDLDGTGAFSEALLSRLSEAISVKFDSSDKRVGQWQPSIAPKPLLKVPSENLAAFDSGYAYKLKHDPSAARQHHLAFAWRAVDADGNLVTLPNSKDMQHEMQPKEDR